MATDSDSDSDLDLDLDLFSDEADQTAASIKAALLQRADQARGQKLAALPPPSQRTPAQNRTAYVLSRQRLQPTVLPRVLTSDECELVVAAVVDYVHRQGGLQSTRHEKFPTTDVPVSDLCLRRGSPPGTAVADLVSAWVSERVLRPLAEKTGFRPHHLGLKDLFVVCYSAPQPGPGRNSPWYPIPSQQTSLAIHSDGCLLSFTLLLNHHDAFQGGGTFFKATARTHRVQQGDVLIHDGGLEHAGAEVTAGQRIILVGFVETIDVLREKLRWEAQSARRRRPIQRHPV
ncbi:hypothetical protein BD289DRAFT_366627 [Coniella lustricola]|uniref:Fe2OG dioxygenase domain-containing protein n=1 Tax=Coniella lustricola TaxID=2025994 RepID=A0A2T3AAR5_9PEZI|nr:hypothetical protein BD289DRAFT_366627 [Coniella lustricola]